MAAITLERHQGQIPEKPPRLEIERDQQAKRFRVKVGKIYYGWFADIASNRKAVVVFLREMYDSETGKWVFTEEELAELVGSTNRQAIDCHMKGFRDADGNLLDFLKHKRKVDDEAVEVVWQVFCSHPYASLSDMVVQANAHDSGPKPLNKSNVREALSQIGGYTVWREMLKGLKKGRAHYEEEYLLKHVLELLSEQAEGVEPLGMLEPSVASLRLQGSEPRGEDVAARVSLPESFREQMSPLFSKAGDPRSLHEQVMEVWEGRVGLVFLAFVLYRMFRFIEQMHRVRFLMECTA